MRTDRGFGIIITLIDQRFFKKVTFETGFSYKSLLFGPFLHIYTGDYLFFFLHSLCCVGSFGIFWVLYPSFYNRKKIRQALERGFRPLHEEQLLELGMELDLAVTDYVGTSRTGSVDHAFDSYGPKVRGPNPNFNKKFG